MQANDTSIDNQIRNKIAEYWETYSASVFSNESFTWLNALDWFSQTNEQAALEAWQSDFFDRHPELKQALDVLKELNGEQLSGFHIATLLTLLIRNTYGLDPAIANFWKTPVGSAILNLSIFWCKVRAFNLVLSTWKARLEAKLYCRSITNRVCSMLAKLIN